MPAEDPLASEYLEEPPFCTYVSVVRLACKILCAAISNQPDEMDSTTSACSMREEF